jgi:phycoerythrin-associated linker protein
MDIKEFITLCAGQWFSQRTSYQLAAQKVENNKSDIAIDLLPIDHAEVIALCQPHHLDTGSSLGGLKASWNNAVDWGQPKQIGSTLLVFLPTADDPSIGKLLKSGNPSLLGHYHLRQDEALTLTIESDRGQFEERLWFASPNLRLRTTIIQHPDKTSQTVFYSEIRKMIAPSSPPSE